jgi:hypothetical protein
MSEKRQFGVSYINARQKWSVVAPAGRSLLAFLDGHVCACLLAVDLLNESFRLHPHLRALLSETQLRSILIAMLTALFR